MLCSPISDWNDVLHLVDYKHTAVPAVPDNVMCKLGAGLQVLNAVA